MRRNLKEPISGKVVRILLTFASVNANVKKNAKNESKLD